jgi:hypothetical protein
MTKQDYENKIAEAFEQAGIELMSNSLRAYGRVK